MRAYKNMFPTLHGALDRQDLIRFEHSIKEEIRRFLPFESYSLFFPREEPPRDGDEPPEASYRPEDRELILPLALDGRLLAWFVARGVRLKAPGTSPGYLARLAGATLEKLALYKLGVTDRLTGLHNRQYFHDALTAEIALVQAASLPAPGGPAENGGTPLDNGAAGVTGTVGVVVLDLDRFLRLGERYGHLVAEGIVAEVGRAVRAVCPSQAVPARFENDRFAIILPDAAPRACSQLADAIRSAVAKLEFGDEVTGDRLSVTASVGHAAFPQSLSGPQFHLSEAEQARVLIRKATQAALTAKQLGRNRTFAFGDILRHGGRVLERLPMNRVAVSLGRTVDARSGQRFLVRMADVRPASAGLGAGGAFGTMNACDDDRLGGDYPATYKAEIVLIEVQEDVAFAEVLHLGDPSFTVDPGDGLRLHTGPSPFERETGPDDGAPKRDMHTGLYSHRDFNALWADARQDCEAFSLILLRLLDQPDECPVSFQQCMDDAVAGLTAMAAQRLGDGLLGGRQGLGGLVLFVPGREPETLREAVLELEKAAPMRLGARLAAGVAGHPVLDYVRADALDNARKALDHAQLIADGPQVAVFDSVTLNISADTLTMQGDLYGAVEEYRQSLSLDPVNLLARNSLGICLAQLHSFEEAAVEFRTVLEAAPEDLMALYNLGWACQRLGDLAEARAAYARCLEVDPDHLYATLRLAGLAERDGDLAEAERLFARAADLPGAEALTMRPLARIAMARGDKEKTREYLHLALSANHNDAPAMHMLARLYLSTGEDPQIAEVLARQSSALTPGRDDYRDLLVECLEKQGKREEARKVAARAAH